MKKEDLCEIVGVVFTLAAVLYFSFPIMATTLRITCEQYTNTGLTITAFAALIVGFWCHGTANDIYYK